jgi:hypothetical protein
MPDDILSQILIFSSPLVFALIIFITLGKTPEQRELESQKMREIKRTLSTDTVFLIRYVGENQIHVQTIGHFTNTGKQGDVSPFEH